jgi:hypothetical protein
METTSFSDVEMHLYIELRDDEFWITAYLNEMIIIITSYLDWFVVSYGDCSNLSCRQNRNSLPYAEALWR